jgi:hypothetical protein
MRLMHDSISFDKILPKEVGHFGTRINWKQPLVENREFGLNARSATRRGVGSAGSSLDEIPQT